MNTRTRFHEATDELFTLGIPTIVTEGCRCCATDDKIQVNGQTAILGSFIQDGTPTWNGDRLEAVLVEEATCTCEEPEFDWEEDEDGEEHEVCIFEGEECYNCRYGIDEETTTTPIHSLFFSYNDENLDKAVKAAEVFRNHGFTVNYDGNPAHTVEVEL